jgi:glycerophosphoryl diester phosphodiesterase
MSPWLGRYYAHRGLHQSKKKSPENSMAAFKLAIEHQYGIELDVQLTKDKIPVVIHDYSVLRVCGIDKKVNEFTLEELQQLNLYSSNEHIPTFEAVLNMINGQVPVIIEYKVETHDTTVCDIVAPMLDKYKGVYCIESFNPLVLMWYRKNHPNIMRGQLSSNLIKDKEEGDKTLYFILSNLLLNFITKPDFIAYNHIHTNMLSFLICKRIYGIPTFAWTIQSQEALEDGRKYFDYMIFDKFIPE